MTSSGSGGVYFRLCKAGAVSQSPPCCYFVVRGGSGSDSGSDSGGVFFLLLCKAGTVSQSLQAVLISTGRAAVAVVVALTVAASFFFLSL